MMTYSVVGEVFQRAGRAAGQPHPASGGSFTKARILVVDDEEVVRDSLIPLLESQGYQVSSAENGRAALKLLYTEATPDLILLDLGMPVMDGWEFRKRQRNDPRLSLIPVVALSADASAQAETISAQAYLRKPVSTSDLLTTIERILLDSGRRQLLRMDETERLASLGRLAAGVGHEINNPLTILTLNLAESTKTLRHLIHSFTAPSSPSQPELAAEKLTESLANVVDMLDDCTSGSNRIRETVEHLQRLSQAGEAPLGPVDVNALVEQAVTIAANQIRHRATLSKALGHLPPLQGDAKALREGLLGILINATQAIPEGDAAHNEIRITTRVEQREKGAEVLIEIRDTGTGIPPEFLPHVFEPFFTTKAVGQGSGLGLSIVRQTVTDHGGRLTVESSPGHGSVFSIFLPVASPPTDLFPPLPAPVPVVAPVATVVRGRILVVDDEPVIGRALDKILKKEHDLVIVQRASEAILALEMNQAFDVILCDLVMPDVSGPAFFELIVKRWPALADRLVFMSGGAFTPGTVEFVKRLATPILAKPFEIERLTQLVRERVRANRQ